MIIAILKGVCADIPKQQQQRGGRMKKYDYLVLDIFSGKYLHYKQQEKHPMTSDGHRLLLFSPGASLWGTG